MKDNSGKILLAMLAGASAGVIAGLMMAPDTGEATRTSVKKWAGKVSKDLEKNLQAGLEEIKNMSGDTFGKSTGGNQGGNASTGGSSASTTGGGASGSSNAGSAGGSSTGGGAGNAGGARNTGGAGASGGNALYKRLNNQGKKRRCQACCGCMTYAAPAEP